MTWRVVVLSTKIGTEEKDLTCRETIIFERNIQNATGDVGLDIRDKSLLGMGGLGTH